MKTRAEHLAVHDGIDDLITGAALALDALRVARKPDARARALRALTEALSGATALVDDLGGSK